MQERLGYIYLVFEDVRKEICELVGDVSTKTVCRDDEAGSAVTREMMCPRKGYAEMMNCCLRTCLLD